MGVAMVTASNKLKEDQELVIQALDVYTLADWGIEHQEAIIRGDITMYYPHVTMRWPDEDDLYVIAELQTEPPEHIQRLAKAIERLFEDCPDIEKKLDKAQYIYAARVIHIIAERASLSDSDVYSQIVKDALKILERRHDVLNSVKLNEVEMYTYLREQEIQRAKAKLEQIKRFKRLMDDAMMALSKKHKEAYEVAVMRYIDGLSGKDIMSKMHLSKDEYKYRRRKALEYLTHALIPRLYAFRTLIDSRMFQTDR